MGDGYYGCTEGLPENLLKAEAKAEAEAEKRRRSTQCRKIKGKEAAVGHQMGKICCQQLHGSTNTESVTLTCPRPGEGNRNPTGVHTNTQWAEKRDWMDSVSLALVSMACMYPGWCRRTTRP